MRILYIITGLGQGGAERVVCDLADSMFAKGHDVKIAYLIGDILTKPIHSEIEIIKLGLNNFSSIPIAYMNLRNILINFKPNIVHSHMIHANLFARLTRVRVYMEKLICSAHSANEGGKVRMGLYRLTHFLSNITTNVSEFASKSYIEKKAVPDNDIITIYNGINFNNFKYDNFSRLNLENELNLDNDVKIILAVGRFHRAKNYPNLLRAIKILKESYKFPFKLLIAGDGEQREEIENLISKLGINKDVVLLGRRNDIPKLMSSCDVFVLSSDYEGLPTVLIEAMACEAKIVATNVSGVSEIVDIFGKIVPINNSEKLSNAIIDIISIPTRNIRGAEFVRSKFNIENISEQWLTIYRNS